jgi:hypothetical protein
MRGISMTNAMGTTLTNYINKRTGCLYHGSNLSYFNRFKSNEYEKIRSFQCNQNMPYWNNKIVNGKMEIVRVVYGKEIVVAYVEKI